MKVIKLIPWPTRVSQAIGYFPISLSCDKNKSFFTFPTVCCTFYAMLIIITGLGSTYCWGEYTPTLNTTLGDSPGIDAFSLNVVFGLSCWQTFAIGYCRLNIFINRNRMNDLWFKLNEVVAPLNLPANHLRGLKLQWNLRLWLYIILSICTWTMMAVEEIGELPFWTGIFDIGCTALSFLHVFSFDTIELFLQITNLAFDSAISTNSVNVMESIHSRKKDFGSPIHTMIQSFWKVEDLVMEFNKVFHNRMVMEMSHFFIMEVFLIYFTINSFMDKNLSIVNCAGSVGMCMLLGYSVYSFCIVSSAVTTKSALYLCELSKLAKQRERCNADPLISRRVE
jgi:ABC-type multidrug transport system fused ATPase/permease subunit